VTKGFKGCDICGIGIGKYLYKKEVYDKEEGNKWRARKVWVELDGEPATKWTGGKIYIIVPEKQGFQEKKKWVQPKKVCPYCYRRYHESSNQV
jgi:hypothetical protein